MGTSSNLGGRICGGIRNKLYDIKRATTCWSRSFLYDFFCMNTHSELVLIPSEVQATCAVENRHS